MIKIKLEILKNECGPIEINGYKVPFGHYYVIDVNSNEVAFSSMGFKEAFKFKESLVHSYSKIGRKMLTLMCSEQFLQTGKVDPVVFLINYAAPKSAGGFDWEKSILGRYFWSNIIHERKYYLASAIYDAGLKILKEGIS